MRPHPSRGLKKLDLFQILYLTRFLYKLLHCSICIVNKQLILISKMSNLLLHCPVCTFSSKLCIWPVNWFVCWTKSCLKPALAVGTEIVQTINKPIPPTSHISFSRTILMLLKSMQTFYFKTDILPLSSQSNEMCHQITFSGLK